MRIQTKRLLALPALLVLPVLALAQTDWDLRWVAAYAVVVNLLTWGSYARDKSRAQSGGWRVPESRLHALEFFGGWPAAYLARNLLRHKSSKLSYRLLSGTIIVLWQLVAIDALLGWRFSEGLIDSIDLILKSRGD